MLAALTIYLLMGGGGVSGPMEFWSEAAENIGVVITDEERKDQVLEVIDSMLDRSKEHNKTLDEMREQLGELTESHDVTAEQFDSFWNEYFDLDAQYSKEIIAARFSLKESLSRDEWAAIFSSASADTSKP
jgi:hypothetical protein